MEEGCPEIELRHGEEEKLCIAMEELDLLFQTMPSCQDVRPANARIE